ncbi:MAG: hypothetical protein V1789_10165 [PVC group bacterium]
MKKIVLTGIAGLMLVGGFSSAGDFKPGSEPDGFRGISWGTEIGELTGLNLLRREPDHGGVDVYARTGETMVVGSAPAAAVEYFFWRGLFYRGAVLTAGAEDYQQLQQAVFAEYGVGEIDPAPVPGATSFSWEGDITSMRLQYQEASRSGSLVLASQKIWLRMQQDGSDTP